MKKVSYLKVFCRNGRVMLITSPELSNELADKKDYIMVLPVLFDTEHIQIREADAKEVINWLPNIILTSNYGLNIEGKKKPKKYFNSVPFSASKLLDDAKELISNLICWYQK